MCVREMVKGKRCGVINLMILHYEFLLNCLIQDNGAGHLNVSVDDLLSFFSRMHWRDIAGKRSFPSWFLTLIHLPHGSIFFYLLCMIFQSVAYTALFLQLLIQATEEQQGAPESKGPPQPRSWLPSTLFSAKSATSS